MESSHRIDWTSWWPSCEWKLRWLPLSMTPNGCVARAVVTASFEEALRRVCSVASPHTLRSPLRVFTSCSRVQTQWGQITISRKNAPPDCRWFCHYGALFDVDRPPGGDRYGEISTEGCLMLADALQLNDQTVVYDLGSGFGRATVLFAMCVVLSDDEPTQCRRPAATIIMMSSSTD